MATICEQFKADIEWWETVGDYRNKIKAKHRENDMETMIFGVQAQPPQPPQVN